MCTPFPFLSLSLCLSHPLSLFILPYIVTPVRRVTHALHAYPSTTLSHRLTTARHPGQPYSQILRGWDTDLGLTTRPLEGTHSWYTAVVARPLTTRPREDVIVGACMGAHTHVLHILVVRPLTTRPRGDSAVCVGGGGGGYLQATGTACKTVHDTRRGSEANTDRHLHDPPEKQMRTNVIASGLALH